MNRGSILIVGSGPSVTDVNWQTWLRTPVMAVSSGVSCVPFRPAYFVSFDRPTFYPQDRLSAVEVQKHIPSGKGLFWVNYRNVVHWEFDPLKKTPAFEDDAILTHFPSLQPNSLLMSVQIAALLGYTRLYFAGCDLLDEEYAHVADVLRLWHPVAHSLGIQWLTISPHSALSYFLPVHGEHELTRLAIGRGA